MSDLTNTYLEQIEAVLDKYRDLIKRKQGTNRLENQRLITLCRAVVHRVAGPSSIYAADIERNGADAIIIPRIVGVVVALQADLKAGYLKTVSELIHGEVFGDFLEMGDHLLERGYKDAAAVVTGSTLEAHLRQLCQKFGIQVEVADSRGNLRAKKAAHGKYDEYSSWKVR